MKVVILQPSYIPWRGYFHQIQKADIFVFYDCVQYDKHGWRNRNKIKTHQGLQWLTIPVATKGTISEGFSIKDIPIAWNLPWADKHLKSFTQNYSKAPYFHQYEYLLQKIFSRKDHLLVDFTCFSTEVIAESLGIKNTKFIRSSSIPSEGNKTDRLVGILKKLGASRYISGPSASAYLEHKKLAEIGVAVEYISYDYPKYPQINGPFEPQVSILDLIFNTGPNAPSYIWPQI